MVFTCSTAQNHTGVRTHIHTHHVETALQQYEDTCPLLSCACKCIPQVRQVIYQAGCAVLRLRVEGVRPKAHTRFGGGWRGRGGHIVTHDHKKKRMCLTFTVPRLNKILSPVSSSSRWDERISPAPSWSLRIEIEMVQRAAKSDSYHIWGRALQGDFRSQIFTHSLLCRDVPSSNKRA